MRHAGSGGWSTAEDARLDIFFWLFAYKIFLDALFFVSSI